MAHQRVGNRRIPRRVTGLSTGGMFLHCGDAGAAPGEMLVLEFDQPDGGTLRVTAEVVHVATDEEGEEGVGLRVTRADWERLRRLVRRSGSPDRAT